MGNNTARSIMQIATHVLAAKIAEAKGDMSVAIEHWKLAVQAQDQLAYDEPPAWPWPVRENLGAALLRSGAPAQAEAVFRRDLELNPNNPRSLLGLAASLRAQMKDQEAQQIQAQAERALRNADVTIRVEDL
jgi:Flp pilus assembly protein TadD